jgi:hypothetical protein
MAHNRSYLVRPVLHPFLFLAITAIGCRKDFIAIPDAAYTIGVVDQYNSSSNNGYIYFHFTNEGKIVNVNYPNGFNGRSIPSNAHIETGYMYMVQYDTAAVSDARMLFCYRITDSAQFNQYLATFTASPPGCY